MRVRVLLPDRVLLDRGADALVAEGRDGHRGLRPRHQDCVLPLVPGVLSLRGGDEGEAHVAVAGGVLVKRGETVTVSARDGVAGTELEQLQRVVRERLAARDEDERRADSALARLEASFVRRFFECGP